MGSYRRNKSFPVTPNLDALPGQLDRMRQAIANPALYSAPSVQEQLLILDRATRAILALRAGLTVMENALATRSRPAAAEVKAIDDALLSLEFK